MNKIIAILLLVCLQLCQFPCMSFAAVSTSYYVAVDGDDTNDGTIDKPFATIGRAQEAVRLVNSHMNNNIVVHIGEGVYPVAAPLVFEKKDSGTNGYRVIYKGNKTTISGGVEIKNWSLEDGVWTAPYDGEPFRQLYINGERKTRANNNDTEIKGIDWWDNPETDYTKKDGIIMEQGVLPDLIGETNIEAHRITEWMHIRMPVERVDLLPDGKQVLVMKQPYFYRSYNTITNHPWEINSLFYIENAKAFLDTPNEWYYSKVDGKIFYYPQEGETIGQAIIPKTENLMVFQGRNIKEKVQNITIEGISFEHSAWEFVSKRGYLAWQASEIFLGDELRETSGPISSAILLEHANSITFTNNLFQHLGASGIRLINGVSNSKVVGNIFRDISAVAVTVGLASHVLIDAPGEEVVKDCEVSNNIIHNVAVEYSGNAGLEAFFTEGLRFNHNEIYDVPYSGISLGWGWSWAKKRNDSDVARNNEIKGNRIYDYGKIQTDGAAIYTLGEQPGSVCAENYITLSTQLYGLYHDEGSAFWTTQSNVIEREYISRTPWLLLQREIYDIAVKDNFMNTELIAILSGVKNISLINNQYCPNYFPQKALDIINRSGLQPEYEALRYKDNDKLTKTLDKLALFNQELLSHSTINSGQQLALDYYGITTQRKIISREMLARPIFASDNEAVATVDENGVVTAHSKGIANITISVSGATGQFHVFVDNKIENIRIFLKSQTYKIGDSATIKVIANGDLLPYTELRSDDVSFNSSDSNVCKVDSDGILTAIAQGKTQIVASAQIGEQTYNATFEITVSKALIKKLSITSEDYLLDIGQTPNIKVIGTTSDGEQKELNSSDINISVAPQLSSQTVSFKDVPTQHWANSYITKLIQEKSINGFSRKVFMPDELMTRAEFIKTVISALKIEGVSDNIIYNDVAKGDWYANDVALAYDYGLIPKADKFFPNRHITRLEIATILNAAAVVLYSETNIPLTPSLDVFSDKYTLDAIATLEMARAVENEYFIYDDGLLQADLKSTRAEAAAAVCRFVYPHLIRSKRSISDYQNYASYRFEERTLRIARDNKNRNKEKQMYRPKNVESVNENWKKQFTGAGKYKLIATLTQDNIAPATAGFFIYDKLDETVTADGFTVSNIGSQAGIAAKTNDGYMLATAGDNVFGKSDQFIFMHKSTSGVNASVEVMLKSVYNNNPYIAAGVMIRASDDPASRNVNYRLRPDGTTTLTWRPTNGADTKFSLGPKLTFPATIKLERVGDQFISYYKLDGAWVEDMYVDVEMPNKTISGIMTYALLPLANSPTEAFFTNLLIK